jgi:acetoin utilization deacetylase AcuC-like enzyme
MGFCFFNNVALAAETARKLGAQRVAVLDFDVHHGNGTQAAFWNRRDVLFLSVHQWPLYPGTGAVQDVGAGEGEGFTVNCPLPAGMGDADYGAVFSEIFLPVMRQYRPDFVLLSAGYDAHAADPLADMRLTERGYAAMTYAAMALAQEVCGGKVVALLEGGYDLSALANSVHATLEVMGGRKDEFPSGVSAAAARAIAACQEQLRPYWKGLLNTDG